MKKFAFQAVFLIIIIFGGLAIYTSQITNLPFITTPRSTKVEEVIINNVKINVEVADTQEKRSRGLSGRDTLASNSGMLFIFKTEDKYPFWMKGLSFPLDFIWIKNDTIVDLSSDVPPPIPNQTDQSLSIYSSKVPINKVLEVPAGTIVNLNIKVGDKIQVIKK